MFGDRRNGFGSGGGERKYGGGGGGDRSRGGQRGGVVFNFYGGGPPRGGGGASRGGGYGYGGPPQPYWLTPGLPPMGYGATRSLNDAGAKLRPIEWGRIQLPPITKNLYREHATIALRAQTEVDQWLTESECTLEGSDIPRPICEFVESGFPQPIIDLLNTHYQRPTVIQAISWPVALSGRDQISIAKTGSGKTLGFILPAIVHTLSQPKRRSGEGPSVLVLLPTRELAIQVEEVAREYCNAMRLELTCCYGGAPKTNQANDLRKGVDICVATPGRILDFLEGNKTNMRRCTFLVLDEADRMLDMGFEPQIRKIVGQIRPDRQTLMFSATWPREVRALAADFQQNPVHLHVGSLELAANHNIQQHVEIVEEHAKQGRLLQLLDNIMRQRECKTLVFVQTKRKADDLTRDMRRDGWPALCIHGDKEQKEREWVLSEFKDGKMPILFATDVAARGLDVSDIKFVINYDYPNNSENYVHRIGRTGRQDKTGTSYTFFSPLSNAPKAADLIKVLEEAKQVVPEELRECALNSFGNNKGKGRRWRPVQPVGDGGPSATKRVKPNNDDGGGFGNNAVGFSIGGPSNSNSWGNNNNDNVTNGFSNSNAAYFW